MSRSGGGNSATTRLRPEWCCEFPQRAEAIRLRKRYGSLRHCPFRLRKRDGTRSDSVSDRGDVSYGELVRLEAAAGGTRHVWRRAGAAARNAGVSRQTRIERWGKPCGEKRKNPQKEEKEKRRQGRVFLIGGATGWALFVIFLSIFAHQFYRLMCGPCLVFVCHVGFPFLRLHGLL